MNTTNTLRGMATVSYWANDVPAAISWYSELLGTKPYFIRPSVEDPQYAEFRIGDYQHELGIISSSYRHANVSDQPGGVTLYWHVDDIEAMHAKVIAMGAIKYEPIIKREAGFMTTCVIDPFGNLLGLMNNPHYLDILSGKK